MSVIIQLVAAEAVLDKILKLCIQSENPATSPVDCQHHGKAFVYTEWIRDALNSLSLPQCTSAANIRGEHIRCDNPMPHEGWPHTNREHEAIWHNFSSPVLVVPEDPIEKQGCSCGPDCTNNGPHED